MQKDKEHQSMTGEDAIAVLKSRRKKSKFWYVLGIIAVGLIFFCLFFRVVILSGDFTVIAKKHPTFSNTFVNLDDYIKRGNRAIEKYNADGRISFTQQRPLENYLLEQNLDVELWKEFMEKSLMELKGKNKE